MVALVWSVAFEQGQKKVRREAAGMGFGVYRAEKGTGELKFQWNFVLLPVE